MVWAISGDHDGTLSDFVEDLGLSLPVLVDDANVTLQYTNDSPFPTAPYPQDWIIGKDGTVRYYNNRFEHDAMVEVIERELAE